MIEKLFINSERSLVPSPNLETPQPTPLSPENIAEQMGSVQPTPLSPENIAEQMGSVEADAILPRGDHENNRKER